MRANLQTKCACSFPMRPYMLLNHFPKSLKNWNSNFSNDHKFKTFNLALGEQNGELEFWENEYSPSSSFLSLADSHKNNFEEAVESKKVKVLVDSLDQVFVAKNLEQPLMIKIDVQGFEDKVIRGGLTLLQKAAMIICELSFVEL